MWFSSEFNWICCSRGNQFRQLRLDECVPFVFCCKCRISRVVSNSRRFTKSSWVTILSRSVRVANDARCLCLVNYASTKTGEIHLLRDLVVVKAQRLFGTVHDDCRRHSCQKRCLVVFWGFEEVPGAVRLARKMGAADRTASKTQVL